MKTLQNTVHGFLVLTISNEYFSIIVCGWLSKLSSNYSFHLNQSQLGRGNVSLVFGVSIKHTSHQNASEIIAWYIDHLIMLLHFPPLGPTIDVTYTYFSLIPRIFDVTASLYFQSTLWRQCRYINTLHMYQTLKCGAKQFIENSFYIILIESSWNSTYMKGAINFVYYVWDWKFT